MIDNLLGKTIIDFLEGCRQKQNDNMISLFQCNKEVYPKRIVIDSLETAVNQDEILNDTSRLSRNEEFRRFIVEQAKNDRKEEMNKLKRKQLVTDDGKEHLLYDTLIKKAKEELCILNWTWFVENNCKSILAIFPNIRDWRWILLEYLFRYYEKVKYGRFINYTQGCPLERYLSENAIRFNFQENYGLLNIDENWILKSGIPSKVFLPKIDTHIILRHIPSDILALIDKCRHETRFKLALRPDYNICGDKIRDLQYVCEEKRFGKSYSGQLSTIDCISQYYDKDWGNDWLIINPEGEGITFEEILEDGYQDQNNYVTQVVHMQFVKVDGKEYITHIDHEYVFYSEDEIKEKRINLRIKGNARKRYKTFKIDDARIPFVNEANSNLLYKVLICYFTKGELIDEYFKG